MRYLSTLILILVGLMLGTFSQAWSGSIEGQVLRTVSGSKEIPVEAAGIGVSQHGPGMPECKFLDTTTPLVFTDSDGTFSLGNLKAGVHTLCAMYDYFDADDPDQFNKRVEVLLAKRVQVPLSGVVKVIFKK